MTINFIDAGGILIFLLISFLIIRRFWFYSLYSFLRFLLFSLFSIAIGLSISSINPVNLFISKIQIALLITSVLFIILWKFVQFKKIFFWLDTHLFKIDRFVYFHKINKIINIPPSFVASAFFTFFLFSILVSLSPHSAFLEHQIDGSRIFKPLSYKIYFSPSIGKFKPFEGSLFKLIPSVSLPKITEEDIFKHITPEIIFTQQDQINEEREKAGLPPIANSDPGSSTTPQPTSPGSGQTPQNPAPTPIVIKLPGFPGANPTSIPAPQQPTQTPAGTTPTSSPSNPTAPTAAPTTIPNPTQKPTSTPTPTQSGPKDTKSIEQALFTLTNQKRSENGVAALSWSEDIAAVARAHSKDMNDRNYFDHNTPDGVTPFQRLTLGGVSYMTAGENIAAAGTAEMIIEAWMKSPGHKANILNPSFGRIGIGVAENSKYGLLATQNFTN